jgi:hypothetical protein
VLLHDHHPGYISWEEFEHNQRLLAENTHMQGQAIRKSGRGGRALLSGLVRCGRCARMMRLCYGRYAHRYQCHGDQRHGSPSCIGVGGVRIDRAVSLELLEAVAPHAVAAAMKVAEQASRQRDDVFQALARELEEARYEARLAQRRYEAVDPDQRLVARELEARWESGLGRMKEFESRLAEEKARAAACPPVDTQALLRLAEDLPRVWNSSSDMALKQRIVRILIQEVIVDVDEATNENVLTIHWTGGRHSEVRVSRLRGNPGADTSGPSAAEVVRILGGQCSDRVLAVTLNRMRSRSEDGNPWTIVRVQELRERLGLTPPEPSSNRRAVISPLQAARRLSISESSVYQLIHYGVLPATQLMPFAPWQIPLDALQTEAVRIGVRRIIERRPANLQNIRDKRTLPLPGI